MTELYSNMVSTWRREGANTMERLSEIRRLQHLNETATWATCCLRAFGLFDPAAAAKDSIFVGDRLILIVECPG